MVQVANPRPLTGELRSGRTVVVAGSSFVDGCEEVEHPMRNVRLVLRQGSQDWDLGEEDAGEEDALGRITWRVRLPADVRPGRAILIAGTAELPVIVGPVGPVRPASSRRTTGR